MSSCLLFNAQLILLLFPVPKSIIMCLFLKYKERREEEQQEEERNLAKQNAGRRGGYHGKHNALAPEPNRSYGLQELRCMYTQSDNN